MPVKVSIVEDDDDIASLVCSDLRERGYEVERLRAASGPDDLDPGTDVFLLDVLLPRVSGFDLCASIRARSNAPIIFTSCLDDSDSIVRAFELGGDDYLVKPFDFDVLDARIKANLRRVDTFRRDGSVEGVYRCAGFEVDARARAVLAGGRERPLTEMEFQILVFLMRNPGRCFTPSELYRNVWGQDSYGDVRTVIAHVHNIRAKVEPDPSSPRYLVRVRGRGYCFLPEGQAPGEPGSRPAPEAGRRARGRRAAN